MPEKFTTPDKYLSDVIKPTLERMGPRYCGATIEKLLCLIAAHESAGFTTRTQIGGPALSFYQIEPATLDDLYGSWLLYRPDEAAMLRSFLPLGQGRLSALETNDEYATCAARLLLWRVPEKLPDVKDTLALAAYAKKYWNTKAGKATAEKYYDDFMRWGDDWWPKEWLA